MVADPATERSVQLVQNDPDSTMLALTPKDATAMESASTANFAT